MPRKLNKPLIGSFSKTRDFHWANKALCFVLVINKTKATFVVDILRGLVCKCQDICFNLGGPGTIP